VLALQRWNIMALGVVFVLLRVLVLTGGTRYLPRLPGLGVGPLQRLPPTALFLGVVFGLSALACAMGGRRFNVVTIGTVV